MGNDWSAELKKPEVWAREKGIVIRDPDGWRHSVAMGDNFYLAQDYSKPVDEREFEARAAVSTVDYNPHSKLKLRAGDQVLPSQGVGKPVQDLIIEEMEESKRVGGERYNSPGLYAFNGRRGLRDAQEEARDLHVYMTQVLKEAEANKGELIDLLVNRFTGDGKSFFVSDVMADQIIELLLGWIAAQREHVSDATIEEAAQRLAEDDGIGTEYSKQEWDQYVRTARVVFGRKPN